MVAFEPKILLAFGAVASCVSTLVTTQAAAEVGCTTQLTGAEQSECIQRGLAEAELELTRAYKAAIRQIESRTDLDPDTRKKWFGAIRSAQRAWINFRDRDCGEPIRFEWLNGSGSGLAAAQCRLSASKGRISQLTERYRDQPSSTPNPALPVAADRQNPSPKEFTRETTPASSDRCTVKTGDKVVPITPQNLSVQLSNFAVAKGEFESNKEFEVKTQQNQAKVLRSYLVAVASSPENLSYDADRERFVISKYVWANISPNLDFIRRTDGSPIGILSGYHGLGLSTTELSSGTYRGSNAYGTSMEIMRIKRQTYGIFDRVSRPGENTWHLDFDKGGGGSASEYTGGIFLAASRGVAQALKSDIRFAVELKPRPPFVLRGSRRFEPRFDRPTDIDEATEIFVGKVGCLVVSDGSGTVLRAVEPGY